MKIKSGWTDLPVADEGRMRVSLSEPDGGRWPGVALIPAIYGATDGMVQLAERLAGQGYVVAVPDPFWRTLPGPLGYDGEDREKAQARYKAFDVEQGVRDLGAVVDWLRERPSTSGGVGVVGVCFGGRYAFLAAARLGVEAAVSYHGTFIEAHLEEFAGIQRRVSLHFGEADSHVPMDKVEAIRRAAGGNPNIEIYTYPEAPHGFMQHDRPTYRAAAAELAYGRGINVLRQALASAGQDA